MLATGQSANALALYVNFHARALLLGRQARLSFEKNGSDASRLTRRALFAEAFALHFLQDGFAAGHVVGGRGTASYRIGTHDYYSRHGIDARTWAGPSYHARGDAFLSSDDLQFAAEATRLSISQLLQVLAGNSLDARLDQEIQPFPSYGYFDVCRETHVPPGIDGLAHSGLVASVVDKEPIPSRRNPEFPRFRSEIGGFFGGVVALDTGGGSNGGLMMARGGARVGAGFGAVTTRHMDNQVFVEAAIAARRMGGTDQIAYAGRLHVPFWIIPLDGIPAFVLGACYPASQTLGLWASEAASGGITGLQRVHRLTENTTAQFSLLRDASLLWHRGESAPNWQLFLPWGTLRYQLPFAGRMSSDFMLDVGTFFVFATDEADRDFDYGGYLSLSTATRVFP